MLNTEEVSDLIIRRICECGWKAYLTGGAVRDNFLDVDPHDYDIVTDATPDELKLIFPDRKVKLVGASFLVTLVDDVEVATYRSDRNTGPGRHNCVTTVCKTLNEDLARRDFTFNAVAVCPYSGEVIDPYNGVSDLNKKLVRFVGNPHERIYEDYLRMIRAARFACLINGRLEYDALKALRMNRQLVTHIAPERIRLELLKVMTYPKPSIFFDVLHEATLLEVLFPELERMYGHTGGMHHNETLDEHFKMTGDAMSPKAPLLRLVGYLHDIGKPIAYETNEDKTFVNHEAFGAVMVENLLNRYKFTNKEVEYAKNLVSVHMRSFDSLTTGKAIRRLLKAFTELNINWKEWLRLKIADKRANLSKDNYKKNQIKTICFKIHNAKKVKGSAFGIKDLAVNGNDVMEIMGIKPGPAVGETLNYLLNWVLEDPTLNTREFLIRFLQGDETLNVDC